MQLEQSLVIANRFQSLFANPLEVALDQRGNQFDHSFALIAGRFVASPLDATKECDPFEATLMLELDRQYDRRALRFDLAGEADQVNSASSRNRYRQ